MNGWARNERDSSCTRRGLLEERAAAWIWLITIHAMLPNTDALAACWLQREQGEPVCACIGFVGRVLERQTLAKFRVRLQRNELAYERNRWHGCPCRECHMSSPDPGRRHAQILGLLQVLAACREPPECFTASSRQYFGLMPVAHPWDGIDNPSVNIFKVERGKLRDSIVCAWDDAIRRLRHWRAIAFLVAFMRANVGHSLVNSGLTIVRRFFASPITCHRALDLLVHDVYGSPCLF